jgi:hypothetical protein
MCSVCVCVWGPIFIYPVNIYTYVIFFDSPCNLQVVVGLGHWLPTQTFCVHVNVQCSRLLDTHLQTDVFKYELRIITDQIRGIYVFKYDLRIITYQIRGVHIYIYIYIYIYKTENRHMYNSKHIYIYKTANRHYCVYLLVFSKTLNKGVHIYIKRKIGIYINGK